MISTGTTYKLIAKPSEYRALHRVAKKVGVKTDSGLSWPTVIAERDGKVIGFLSSKQKKGSVIAGPIAVDVDGATIFVARRLVEFYELFLYAARVPHYFFNISKDNKRWVRTVKDLLKLEPYAEKDGVLWFKRKL